VTKGSPLRDLVGTLLLHRMCFCALELLSHHCKIKLILSIVIVVKGVNWDKDLFEVLSTQPFRELISMNNHCHHDYYLAVIAIELWCGAFRTQDSIFFSFLRVLKSYYEQVAIIKCFRYPWNIFWKHAKIIWKWICHASKTILGKLFNLKLRPYYLNFNIT
jgi:hypothetical protein